MDRSLGEQSATSMYQFTEGVDVKNGQLYFVSKTQRQLFMVDLRGNTYTVSSTASGAFNRQPDQIAHILNDKGSDILYFTEDGGEDCDVHGRDSTGQFYTILKGPGFNTETTGLAFSPDARVMYVAFQGPSAIFQVQRTDGCTFGGGMVDVHYHNHGVNGL